MLCRSDDYFVHQNVDTVGRVANSDPRFTDRLVFYVHDKPGDVLLMLGLGAWPNIATMDGYCIIVKDGVQHNIRFSRVLENDRDIMVCGPLTLEILEPQRRWRLRMEDNEQGVAFDLEFVARSEPFLHTPIHIREQNYSIWNQMHYQQSGRCTGWISVDGDRSDIENWWGVRDRSWGVRGAWHNGPPRDTVWGDMKVAWMTAQFDDRALQNWCFKDFKLNRVMHVDGNILSDDGSKSDPFVDWSYSIEETNEYGSATVVDNVLASASGRRHVLRAEEVHTYYIAGILFDDGDFYGKWRGSVLEGSRWNLRDRSMIEAIKKMGPYGTETLARYTLDDEHHGFGIYESSGIFGQ